MKTLLIIVISVLLFMLALVYATLVRNQAQWFQPPGLMQRLSVYLTQHEAVTSDNHEFVELRTPVFDIEAEKLFDVTLAAATELGWQLQQSDNENLSAHFVVTTPLLGFKDDLKIQVKLLNKQPGGDASALLISSRSRAGKADFAANAGHIQALVAAVKYQIRLRVLRMYQR